MTKSHRAIKFFFTIIIINLFLLINNCEAVVSPYPRSSVITGITFDQATLVKAAAGSDQFGYTTAANNNIYIAWGDGGGFGGTNSLGRASLGIGRIEGIPPAWTGYNVWGGLNPESSQPSILGKADNGIIVVNGIMYVYVQEQDVWTNSNLWKSTDLGMTWSDLGQMFNEPNGEYGEIGIIQFGPNYQGAKDNYIYGYSQINIENELGLFRVDKSQIENRAMYEFFTGVNGDNQASWSNNISDGRSVFTDPAGVEWGATVTYNPHLDMYLLAVRHDGETGKWGLFNAPTPWGPWTTIAYDTEFPIWTYSPDPDGASADRPAYMHNFPIKWMSSDGKTMWQMSDRGDQLNIVKATLTISHSDVNSDFEINSIDAMLTLRYSLNMEMAATAWQDETNTGDANCDDVSTSTDALLILRYSIGLEMEGTEWCE